eukprot:CAMPEP_0180316710 /NCGR_PEP_ID=MMETSP0988-20121125/33421_1 /TAXON_ID=697907 /ORGANISM="non described non described, Strain CCMP2293" /LENGTH=97 /DNA_ID=CAMNT_0022301861 /DNA_START=46 /DNA_END=339 /DNA_ORIENTATION=-
MDGRTTDSGRRCMSSGPPVPGCEIARKWFDIVGGLDGYGVPMPAAASRSSWISAGMRMDEAGREPRGEVAGAGAGSQSCSNACTATSEISLELASIA